jgi:hypothetical protein
MAQREPNPHVQAVLTWHEAGKALRYRPRSLRTRRNWASSSQLLEIIRQNDLIVRQFLATANDYALPEVQALFCRRRHRAAEKS